MNKFEGVWNAAAQKRYKNFVTTVADTETVWLCEGGKLSVWPELSYAQKLFPNEKIMCMDVHDFCCSVLEKYPVTDCIYVFPNDRDAFIAEPQNLLVDIQNELDRVE